MNASGHPSVILVTPVVEAATPETDVATNPSPRRSSHYKRRCQTPITVVLGLFFLGRISMIGVEIAYLVLYENLHCDEGPLWIWMLVHVSCLGLSWCLPNVVGCCYGMADGTVTFAHAFSMIGLLGVSIWGSTMFFESSPSSGPDSDCESLHAFGFIAILIMFVLTSLSLIVVVLFKICFWKTGSRCRK